MPGKASPVFLMTRMGVGFMAWKQILSNYELLCKLCKLLENSCLLCPNWSFSFSSSTLCWFSNTDMASTFGDSFGCQFCCALPPIPLLDVGPCLSWLWLLLSSPFLLARFLLRNQLIVLWQGVKLIFTGGYISLSVAFKGLSVKFYDCINVTTP